MVGSASTTKTRFRSVNPMPDDVRALCKARFGDEPCSSVFNAKGEPVSTKECETWCPLLGRRIEEEDDANDD